MPAKNIKSNIAKTTSRATLGRKAKFNWKIAAVIIMILAVALGYLYVRLSKAGGYVWAPKDMQLQSGGPGELVTKNDGRPAVQSTPISSTSDTGIVVSVWPAVSQSDTYCVNGNATGDTQFAGTLYTGNQVTALNAQKVGAGPFTVCWTIQGPTTGQRRRLVVSAHAPRDKVFAFFSIERKDPASGPGTKTSGSAPANPTMTPGRK